MDSMAEFLKQRMAEGRMIGFCPWKDREGLLFGYILEVDKKRFRVQKIGTLGENDEEESFKLSEITYLDLGEDYIRRLEILKDFKPTLPEEVPKVTKRNEVRAVLERALVSQEFLCLKLLGEVGTDTCKVISIGKTWVDLQRFDDFLRSGRRVIVKVSAVKWARAGSAMQEAEAFVLEHLSSAAGE